MRFATSWMIFIHPVRVSGLSSNPILRILRTDFAHTRSHTNNGKFLFVLFRQLPLNFQLLGLGRETSTDIRRITWSARTGPYEDTRPDLSINSAYRSCKKPLSEQANITPRRAPSGHKKLDKPQQLL